VCPPRGERPELWRGGHLWAILTRMPPLNLVTITYDADADVTKLQDANTNYQHTYNADDEVSTFADNGTTGLPLVTLTYSYDGVTVR
jgi:hypothetical protein